MFNKYIASFLVFSLALLPNIAKADIHYHKIPTNESCQKAIYASNMISAKISIKEYKSVNSYREIFNKNKNSCVANIYYPMTINTYKNFMVFDKNMDYNSDKAFVLENIKNCIISTKTSSEIKNFCSQEKSKL